MSVERVLERLHRFDGQLYRAAHRLRRTAPVPDAPEPVLGAVGKESEAANPASASCMMFVDFDGVLNPMLDDPRISYADIGRLDSPADAAGKPDAGLFGSTTAFVVDDDAIIVLHDDDGMRHGYHVRWSGELADSLFTLIASRRVDFRWLTTWQPYTARLAMALGWDPDRLATVEWYDPDSRLGLFSGKFATIAGEVERQRERRTTGERPRPIIWIDDEEITDETSKALANARPAAPVLLVKPDGRIGVSRDQWKQIVRFAVTPPADPAVYLAPVTGHELRRVEPGNDKAAPAHWRPGRRTEHKGF
ncbi:hypothetical protein [Bifidobacterium choloepi]|uniref:Uncharacterized protein n=1 Tax=Bifidobacterium choloepi TaxID=2614131 RepID=A0A6I5N0Y9_9BIFI|nr:hypothetical protein [Bifidobacterium choloepi]NEG70598.1 hypothetical protein [Bifidobacterium choloepi]